MTKAKSSVSKKMDSVQAPIAAFLKSIGFRKQGRTFNRSVKSGIVQVVNFQMGGYPIGPHYEIPGIRKSFYGNFTVNLGVYISDIYEVTMPRTTTFPREYHCEIRARLSELATGDDSWWDLNGDVDLISQDVIRKLENFGVPLLERFQTRDAIVSAWIPYSAEHALDGWLRSRLPVALILLNRDNRAAAQALFDEHIKRPTRNPGHVNFVKELARRVGLDSS